MPKKTLPLADAQVRNAKPQDKQYTLFDGGGLFLEILPSGGKCWRLKYRHADKEKRITFGQYPAISLQEARRLRDEARSLVARGVDPGEERKKERIEAVAAAANTFEKVARDWHKNFSPTWTEHTRVTNLARLERNIFPRFGGKPITEISAQELLDALRKVEGRGNRETAKRLRILCGQVFRFGIATQRCQHDITADLKGALAPVTPKNFAAITNPREVGGLLRAIDGYTGSLETRAALKLAPLVFLRPGELRAAEWSELDLDAAEWRIPVERMKMTLKMKKERAGQWHLVPLSRQAVAIFRELQLVNGKGRFCFPSGRTGDRAMSNNAVLAALRRMGFSKDEMCGHGFRAMASTLLHERGWPSGDIELQLAHRDGNKVRAAYNHAERLPERRKMMQWWADYLDTLQAGVQAPPA